MFLKKFLLFLFFLFVHFFWFFRIDFGHRNLLHLKIILQVNQLFNMLKFSMLKIVFKF